MSAMLVTYDLNKETRRPNIVGAIKKYHRWAKLSESSYAIDVDQSPGDVYNNLKQFLDSNDNLYVIKLKEPHRGFGPKEVNEWLDKNLPY